MRMYVYRVSLLLLLSAMGCLGSSGIEPFSVDVEYLALGDSYTYGESVGRSETFPRQLAEWIGGQLNRQIPVASVARTGWTTGDLLAHLDAMTLLRQPSLVTLCIGVNNEFRGISISVYRTEFAEILQRAIGYAGGDPTRVIVLSIPDYRFTPFGQSAPSGGSIGVDAYNDIAREAVLAAGAQFVDITPISREGLEEPALVSYDRLHPSAEQYRRWAELFRDDALLLF